MYLDSTSSRVRRARRMGWIHLALTALPVLVVLVAPVFAQQPGNIFDASDQTLGNGLKAFIRYMRNFFFLLGFIFLALMGWNIANNKPWGNKLAGAVFCWGFAAIGSLIYTFTQGEDVDLDTDL